MIMRISFWNCEFFCKLFLRVMSGNCYKLVDRIFGVKNVWFLENIGM